MPELPEVTLYINALRSRVVGRAIEGIRVRSPSLLRTYDPPLSAVYGKTVLGLERLGKRIVWVLEDDLFLVLHLMVAGRLQWKDKGAPVPGKVGHAAFDFANGTLLLTEAGTKKRAALFVFRGRAGVDAENRGGIEPLEATPADFADALRRENHTLKRSLTDPRLFSGIGGAHADEIMFEAQVSPVKRTSQLTDEEVARLQAAAREELARFTDLLLSETGDGFPGKVTAFHPAMKVHGKFGKPCPRCGAPIQRIVYASNETNYCAVCQTGGKLLADRALSRLLGEDWPRTLEDLEELKR